MNMRYINMYHLQTDQNTCVNQRRKILSIMHGLNINDEFEAKKG